MRVHWFVHVQAEQPPLGSQAPGQPLHEHPLFRRNLHPGHWSQRLGGGNQSLLHLIGAAAMVQNVVVKIRRQKKGFGLGRGLG